MARCLDKKCYHDNLVQAMLGREGEDDLTNAEIEAAAQENGNPPDFALPNDHSRRFDGKNWCTLVDQCGQQRLAPNKMPLCTTCCYDGIHHIFWSWRDCTVDSTGTHHHDKPNRYKVVDQLHWCDGTIASNVLIFESAHEFESSSQSANNIVEETSTENMKLDEQINPIVFKFTDCRTFRNHTEHGWQISCEVENRTQKNIRAFRGMIQCFDIFESFMFNFGLVADSLEVIDAGKSLGFSWHWQLNQFSKEYIWLSGRKHKDVILRFKLDTILYEDGSRDSFD